MAAAEITGGATLSFDHRHFHALGYGLVAANRLRVNWTFGDLPFYEELGHGGGSGTVRGVASARDRGEARIVFNGELRWRGLPVWHRQHLYLGLVAFGDPRTDLRPRRAADERRVAPRQRHGVALPLAEYDRAGRLRHLGRPQGALHHLFTGFLRAWSYFQRAICSGSEWLRSSRRAASI